MNRIDGIETADRAPALPWDVFREWFADAEASELNDPNAMTLATVDERGLPNARIVLMKAWDQRGLVFYTNRESRKGLELAAHANAALIFHWKSLARQVRVQGAVELASDAESDAYYASRGRGSRIGAWSSQQSQVLPDRAFLAARVDDYKADFGATGPITRPPHWGGYRVIPSAIEFWSEGRDRLHTRVLYRRDGHDEWTRQLLFP